MTKTTNGAVQSTFEKSRYYWPVVEAFLKENHVTKHHVDSYNEFVNKKVHKIIEEFNEIEVSKEGMSIKFHKIRLESPKAVEADGSAREITPTECRLRKRTYAARMFVEMSLLDDGVEKDRDTIYIGDLPVMVRSDLCYLKDMTPDELVKAKEDSNELGGYFIINGSEKVLVSVEDLAPNRLIVSKEEKGGKNVVAGRIFSVKGGFRAKAMLERSKEGLMYLTFPTSAKNLNVFIVMKALGLDNKEKMLEVFSNRAEIINDVLLNLESTEVETRTDALDYIGKRIAAGQPETYRKKRAGQILDNYLLPHIGITENERLKKAYYLAKMADGCIEVSYGKRAEDDKDHYSNKRLKSAGDIVEELFRYAISYFIKDIKYQIERAYTRGRKLQLKTLVRPDAVTDHIRFTMATGTFGGRTGLSQLLDRLNYMSANSHLRRVISPLSKTQPHFEARDLHPTHWGKICPNETPEGQSCGLVKNLSIGTVISTRETTELDKSLAELGVELIKK